jgi:quinol-cytochrome oxidoreductase complex cytochrome b subunit
MAPNRSTFVFIFTATLAAVFLIVTGLIGYQPPAHLSLDAATWRLGVWTDEVILVQVALGVALLAAVGVVAVRVNRRLAHGR